MSHERNGKNDNVTRLPVEFHLNPLSNSDTRPEGKEAKNTFGLTEPGVVANFPDTQFLGEVHLELPRGGREETRALTMGLMRAVLKRSPEQIRNNNGHRQMIEHYLRVLSDEIAVQHTDARRPSSNKVEVDVLAQAKLHRYIAQMVEEVRKAGVNLFDCSYDAVDDQRITKHHEQSALYYEHVARNRTGDKKSSAVARAINEWLAAIKVMRLKKDLSKDDFNQKKSLHRHQLTHDAGLRKLAKTLREYDEMINERQGKIVRLQRGDV